MTPPAGAFPVICPSRETGAGLAPASRRTSPRTNGARCSFPSSLCPRRSRSRSPVPAHDAGLRGTARVQRVCTSWPGQAFASAPARAGRDHGCVEDDPAREADRELLDLEARARGQDEKRERVIKYATPTKRASTGNAQWRSRRPSVSTGQVGGALALLRLVQALDGLPGRSCSAGNLRCRATLSREEANLAGNSPRRIGVLGSVDASRVLRRSSTVRLRCR